MRRSIYLFVLILLLGILHLQAKAQSGSVIKGKVTDNEGNPLQGASITIENTFWGVQSAVDGTFILKGLNDGKLNLNASFIGFETFSQEIILTGEYFININLYPYPFLLNES